MRRFQSLALSAMTSLWLTTCGAVAQQPPATQPTAPVVVGPSASAAQPSLNPTSAPGQTAPGQTAPGQTAPGKTSPGPVPSKKAASIQVGPQPAGPLAADTKSVPVGKSCFRMTLSDIQIGRDETIASARKKLMEEYAPATARSRGLKGRLSVPTNEAIRCEDYLWLPILGQEYKCFVTATFCAR